MVWVAVGLLLVFAVAYAVFLGKKGTGDGAVAEYYPNRTVICAGPGPTPDRKRTWRECCLDGGDAYDENDKNKTQKLPEPGSC